MKWTIESGSIEDVLTSFPSSLGRITCQTKQTMHVLAAAAAVAELLLGVDRQTLHKMLLMMLAVILGIESKSINENIACAIPGG